jgi:hypothetical protein
MALLKTRFPADFKRVFVFEVEVEFCMWDPPKKLRKAIKNSFCG